MAEVHGPAVSVIITTHFMFQLFHQTTGKDICLFNKGYGKRTLERNIIQPELS